MSEVVSGRVEVRARESEVWWKWAFVVTFALLAILLLTKYLRLSWPLLLLFGVVVLALFLYLVRSRPELDMYDAWLICRNKEFRSSKTRLPRSPDRMECQAWGRYYLLQVWNEEIVASFLFNRETHGVDGRRIRGLDDVKKDLEGSKIMTEMSRESVLRRERERLLESKGFAPEEVVEDGEEQ